MHSFMIERLRVSGAGKIDGVINFTDGLNIIQGRSNTGKTWILKSIYYLFGSDTRPYSPLTGYTDIEGIFLTRRYGRITMSRKLDEEEVTVVAESEEVEDGEYDTNYTKKTSLRYLNDLWLRIIGLDETIEVPKTARYARERMSWTSITSVFFVDEKEIDKSESIVIKDQRYETPLIASLFFLLTGDYKKGIPEITKPEVATAKKKAAIDYIEEQVASLTEKRVSYIMQLEELAGLDIEREMQELSYHIQEVQQEIKELIEENTAIVRQMAEYQQEDANCRVLLDRYESLISQYKADLLRLDFISKGEKAVKGLPGNGVCPFCGGEFHPEEDNNYVEAINAEIKRIAAEFAVIAATENNVREEQGAIRASIEELQARRADINEALDKKNREIQNYRSGLQRFKDYTTLQTGIDFVNEQLAILGQKKVAELQKKKNPPLYHAKQEFEEEVGTSFNVLLNRILKECNYRNAGYASWVFSTFDILMDGVPKSEDQGKGYRSFLNSVVALMLYEYFNSDKVFVKPGFLMIDTLLLGFDENEDEFGDNTIKEWPLPVFHKPSGRWSGDHRGQPECHTREHRFQGKGCQRSNISQRREGRACIWLYAQLEEGPPEGVSMKLSYKKLWVMLVERDMKKTEFAKKAKISSASLAKLGKGANVTTDVLVKICEELKCDIRDICEVVPDDDIDDKAGNV